MKHHHSSSAASRLCSQCGMCCNGVMFRLVQLEPEDSPQALTRLGLKLKRKDRQPCIIQPCPAHAGSQCSIYAQRPARCRLFECRQIQRIADGEITETMAASAITQALTKVEAVRGLLQQSDGYSDRKSLSKCYENALAEWLYFAPDEKANTLRQQLTLAMRELQELLNRDFRLEPMELDPPVPHTHGGG